jgi:hypothetical protein
MDDGSEKKQRHSRSAWAGLGMVALAIAAVVVLFLARGGDSGGDATAATGDDPAGALADGGEQPPKAASLALEQVRRESGESLVDGGIR